MNSIVDSAKAHCIQLLEHSRCKQLPFHSIQHTLEVYDSSKHIGEYEGLADEQLEPILLAALFHDTGLTTLYRGHEYVGAANAQEFLRKNNYPLSKIQIAVQCILATQIPQEPKTIHEKVLCDADLAYLGSPDCLKKNIALRLEWDQFLESRVIDQNWYTLHMDSLENHTYYTKYGQEVLQNNRLVVMGKNNRISSI